MKPGCKSKTVWTNIKPTGKAPYLSDTNLSNFMIIHEELFLTDATWSWSNPGFTVFFCLFLLLLLFIYFCLTLRDKMLSLYFWYLLCSVVENFCFVVGVYRLVTSGLVKFHQGIFFSQHSKDSQLFCFIYMWSNLGLVER